jgi:hypothetical protein
MGVDRGGRRSGGGRSFDRCVGAQTARGGAEELQSAGASGDRRRDCAP